MSFDVVLAYEGALRSLGLTGVPVIGCRPGARSRGAGNPGVRISGDVSLADAGPRPGRWAVKMNGTASVCPDASSPHNL
jgi:hypothetical protein